MRSQNWIPQALRALYDAKQYQALKAALVELEEVDIAEFLNALDTPDFAAVFRLLPKEVGLDVFIHLDSDAQEALINAFKDNQVEALLDRLYNDDLTDLLDELPANVTKRLLAHTPPERRQLLNRLLQFPEDSAGAMMTTEYVHFHRSVTIGEAFAKLRTLDEKIEMAYNCYITSEDNVLEGVISMREIFTSQDDETVGDVMEDAVISVQTTDDKEDVAHLFERYDFLALPVTDSEHRLVGIITVDDAVDVMQAEAVEDVSKMAAVGAPDADENYMETSIWKQARKRLPWLFVLMLSGILNGRIVNHFENAFLALPILVSFMPMLTDTSGNAGSQASALLIRAIALREVSWKDLGKVLWKELRVGLVAGLGLAVVNCLRVYFMDGRNLALSLTVSLTVMLITTVANLVGGFLPLIAKSFHLDPAVMSGPLLQTVLDAASVLIYFSLAMWMIPGLV